MKLVTSSIDRIAVISAILSVVLYSIFLYVLPEKPVGLMWDSPRYFILWALGANLISMGLSLIHALGRRNSDLRPAKLMLANLAIFSVFVLLYFLTSEAAIRADLTSDLFEIIQTNI